MKCSVFSVLIVQGRCGMDMLVRMNVVILEVVMVRVLVMV